MHDGGNDADFIPFGQTTTETGTKQMHVESDERELWSHCRHVSPQ